MNSLVVTGPILILLFSAILCIMFFKYPKIQKSISLAGTLLFALFSLFQLVTVYRSGIIAIQIGSWAAPFGITLVADMFAVLMMVTTAIIAITVLCYAIHAIDEKRKSQGFYPIFLFVLFGISGAFLTGDIFNLYVWFEVMLVSSFVLISLGNTKQQLEGSVKYVVLSLLSSGFLLSGIAILYKTTGTLNMADLAVSLKTHSNKNLVTLSAIFFFMSFGIKAAVFPLFSWLPASYHTPPVAIAALMAGLLTKVGVYALIRTFTLFFIPNLSITNTFLLIIAGFTMVTGVLGAIAHNDIRKLLSFHIISQIGYMVMGLALYTPLAIAGTIFFIIHNILVKTNLFLISGMVKLTGGSYMLSRSGGIYDKFPAIAVLFAISAFSLAGIPPLSGFWGKYMLAKAGFEIKEYTIAVISLVVGLLTLFSMTKIWLRAFLPAGQDRGDISGLTEKLRFSNTADLFIKKYLIVSPTIFLAMIIMLISFFAEPLIKIAYKAANQLLHPEQYINAVLNNMP